MFFFLKQYKIVESATNTDIKKKTMTQCVNILVKLVPNVSILIKPCIITRPRSIINVII